MCSSPKRRPKALCWSCVELLVAEEDHQVLHQRVMDLLEGLVAERPGEIDAEDLGADHGRELAHLDGLVAHGFPPYFCRKPTREKTMSDTLILRAATRPMRPPSRRPSPRPSSNTAASSCRSRAPSAKPPKASPPSSPRLRRHHRGAERPDAGLRHAEARWRTTSISAGCRCCRGARRRASPERLVEAVEDEARRRELAGVRLGVRVVLTENQRLFAVAGLRRDLARGA